MLETFTFSKGCFLSILSKSSTGLSPIGAESLFSRFKFLNGIVVSSLLFPFIFILNKYVPVFLS